MAGERAGGESSIPESLHGEWRRAQTVEGHPLGRLDGSGVGDGVRMAIWLGPRNHVGSSYFRAYLETDDFGRTTAPVVFGMQNAGPYPGYNWVEILEWRDVLPLEDGRSVEVPAGVERLIFVRLGELVPPGGHFMAEYESPSRVITARALALRVPPAATPLGALLAAAGCGDAFKDWYISEGGREGPRKLQGFHAVDETHAQQRARETRAALEAFLERGDDLDWNVLAQTRPIAQEALARLAERA